MNTEWPIGVSNKFITMTLMCNGSGSNAGAVVITARNYTGASDAEVTKRAQVVEKIFNWVIPASRTEIEGSKNNRWTRPREAAIRTREELIRAEEVKESLGANAPELSAAELHPWTWSSASSLWQSGHYREAVEGAIKKLNAETQNKVGRRDVSESDLFKQAFSTDEPRAGKARLRRMTPDDNDTYKSVHRGAMAFAEGIVASIPNPLSHEADQELSEQEALEYLAALSVRARWVDGSEVETAK